MQALQQPVKLFIGPVMYRDYFPDFLAVMNGKYPHELNRIQPEKLPGYCKKE